MRVFIKKHILNLLITVREAILYVEKSFEDKVACIEILKDCADALFSIENSLKSGFSIENYQNNYENSVKYLVSSIEYIANKLLENENIGEYKKDIVQKIELIINKLNSDKEVKLEIVFLPYKASMWDTLESIWLSAKEDERCNSYVIPIPYYDRDSNGRLSVYHYEGDNFPSYVPIHDYKSYVLPARKPDIIYIHNPYDGYNRVTSVAPEYYSDKLKQYTDMLVYIPYYIIGSFENIQLEYAKIKTPAVVNSNLTIVQSEKYKQLFLECGFDNDKIQALGTPKLDINNEAYNFEKNEEWEQKIKNKKVILINLTLAIILENDVWLDVFFNLLKDISKENNMAIIFRPHPLTDATIISMRPNLVSKYKEMKEYINSSNNIIFDTTTTLNNSLYYSNAMISTSSSLVYNYLLTEKPLLILTDKEIKMIDDKSLIFNYLGSYFNIVSNESFCDEENNSNTQDDLEYISISEFISIVLNDNDYNKEKRINNVKESMGNITGTCGGRIHNFTMKKFLN